MKPFQTTPVFNVSNLEQSIKYYVDVLGFEKLFEWGEPAFYAGVKFGPVVIHLNTKGAADRLGKGEAYIFTEGGVDDYYALVMGRGAEIVGNPPEAYDYGLKDVRFKDPDGNYLTVGEEC